MTKAKVKSMRYNVVVGPDYSKEQLEALIADVGDRGDLSAGIKIVMHNQVILNDKLNKLAGRKTKVIKSKK